MALQPHAFGHGCAQCGQPTAHRPLSLMDQLFHFPDQLFEVPSSWLEHATQNQVGRATELVNTTDKFKLNLSVEGFKPEELQVKVIRDHFLVVHGKHAERGGDDATRSFEAREFTRSFVIPHGVDLAKLKTNLTADGALTIEAPKKSDAIKHERAIPIEFRK